MKVIILNGSLKGQNNLMVISNILEEELANLGWETESVLLNQANIKTCLGCFECFDTTPGICVIKDEARVIAEKMINNNLVIYVSPLTFGGWSSELKKMMDRSLPLLQAGFAKQEGEYHHRKRYKKYPSIIGIGVSNVKDDEVEDIFKNLVKRNSLSMHSPKQSAKVFLSDENEKFIREDIRQLYIEMEIVR